MSTTGKVEEKENNATVSEGNIDTVPSENVKVCLRIRPMNKLEISRRSKLCLRKHPGKDTITIDSPLEGTHDFTFHRVFDEEASQISIYQYISSIAYDIFQGYSCALISYGITGSGKSYTLLGSAGASSDSHGEGKTQRGYESQSSISFNDKESLSGCESESADSSHNNAEAEKSGLIPKVVGDIFTAMRKTPSTTEYLVRCSYVLIYMEKMIDLLVPTTENLTVIEYSEDLPDSDGRCFPLDKGAVVDGLSEICCTDEADVVALLLRGNAARTISCNKLNTDACVTHSVFIMNIEQRDSIKGRFLQSRVYFADLAGSEFGGKDKSKSRGNFGKVQLESVLVNRGFVALANVVKSTGQSYIANDKESDGKRKDKDIIANPHRMSKVTKLLKEALGGNCKTNIIINVSPSSYNITETMETLRFGQKAMKVRNYPVKNEASMTLLHEKKVDEYKNKFKELTSLVHSLILECDKLKSIGLQGPIPNSSFSGPLWVSINQMKQLIDSSDEILPNFLLQRHQTTFETNNTSAKDLSRLKKHVKSLSDSRDRIEGMLADKQSEIVILKNKIGSLEREKKQISDEAKNTDTQVRHLTAQVQDLENKLRTSQFRESEAIIFLRQFRKFYRRLLRNKATQGTGDIAEIIAQMPGVPNLKDLVDIDWALFQSGLIEKEQLHDDGVGASFKPSAMAWERSTVAAHGSATEGAGEILNDQSNSTQNMNSAPQSGISHSSAPVESDSYYPNNSNSAFENGSSKESSQLDSSHAAGSTSMSGNETYANDFLGELQAKKLTTASLFSQTDKEKELENSLATMTERCIQLQMALIEEKTKNDFLINRSGQLNQKKLAQEAIILRQTLERKKHDLHLIISKMNELNIINMAHNERMNSRNLHVKHLEECIVNLQSSNRSVSMENHQSEAKLKEELEHLQVLIDAMTIPLWQFGENKVSERVLPTRVLLPVKAKEELSQHVLHHISVPDTAKIQEDNSDEAINLE